MNYYMLNLAVAYEDLMFPPDAKVLVRNCLDFLSRIQQASSKALATCNFLKNYDSISSINYPTMVASSPLRTVPSFQRRRWILDQYHFQEP